MRKESMQKAIAEAKRFIEAAEMAFPDLSSNSQVNGTKHTAAARRASLDLTRALAEARRS
jgi:hypothetical protein